MNILLVDDDFFFQKAMSFFLNELGHKVHFAVDGEKALDFLKKDPGIDLLICDLDMPVMGGERFISAVKALSAGKKPVIVIVSGLKQGKTLLKRAKIGYDYYFEKPLDVNAFGETLDQIRMRSQK